MPFRIAARTILQLGAELISSDAIAFYELIKNAFDAGSPRVEVEVNVRIPSETLLTLRRRVDAALDRTETTQREAPPASTSLDEVAGGHLPTADFDLKPDEDHKDTFEVLRSEILSSVDPSAPGHRELVAMAKAALDLCALAEILAEANYISIEDTGKGMSLEDLNTVYLTIGTRVRLTERELRKTQPNEGKPQRPILGEKGVGRLSAMRLGDRLRVLTTQKGEPQWNELTIDWSRFSHASDAYLEDVDISPVLGTAKDDKQVSGTRLRISALSNAWSEEKLRNIAVDQFSRLTDPFTPSSRFPISIKYNRDTITIPRFEQNILKHAHATVTGSFSSAKPDGPILRGRIVYKHRMREKTFIVRDADIVSLSGVPLEVLRSLGPFDVTFYWYNRQALTALEDIGDLARVREIQSRWAGGLMVFRDGFRVHPYADPADDWLGLDKKALGSSGFKVNRRQIIGKVDITSEGNPHLVDQTNREGLRDSPERHALVAILQHLMWSQFKAFLDDVDREVNARLPATLSDIQARVIEAESRVKANIDELLRHHPAARENSGIVESVNEALAVIRDSIAAANELAASFEQGRTQLVHLASLGLMVEFLAHELNRATSRTIATLSEAEHGNLPIEVSSLFATLEAQLKTLQKRLRILDPLSTRGRQVKERFELVDWTRQVLSAHEAQFRRHSITCSVSTVPESDATIRVHAVKGMVVQILENLISNSVYWLKQQKALQRDFDARIEVQIDARQRCIEITDNGPGIDPSRREEVFQAFVTTKPPGTGSGLGLFVSKEIAAYNQAYLSLSDERRVHPDRLNTFVLELEPGDAR